MTTDFGEDMNCQFLEILRSLLDSYTLSGAQVPALTILPSNICFNYLFSELGFCSDFETIFNLIYAFFCFLLYIS